MESRACDRCWTMKSQCDRRQPCSRCARLNIDCGTRRPQARRGRPRKQRGRSSRSLTTHSEDTTGSPGGSVAVDNSASSERQIEVTQHTPITLMDVLENAVELHTPTSRAALHSTPSPALPDGRFTCQVLNGEVVLAPVIRWLVRMSSQPQDRADKYPAVSFALLAICMQMEYEVTSRMSPQRLDYMIDSLRVQCLKDIPALTWKSCETKIDHAKVLVLVSHFWCMKEDLALIADRWNSLASLINMEAMRVRSNAQTDRETDDT
ncbi:hypothetical protein C7974DRAFT_107726 [Boeremia exigua]|uniref:uncharacterized protein n=1 Tax=Boeremia exigua TaxID=749465 RepID=UPI001E8D4359|nr:uncharacterized protein C7974DRAFT_107726 [Boeremia exigua]KAH6642722.1 hypothetical protein C7974DRAFT_107726 [Boeremia exigua]